MLCIGLEEPFATRMWLEEDESGHCVSMVLTTKEKKQRRKTKTKAKTTTTLLISSFR